MTANRVDIRSKKNGPGIRYSVGLFPIEATCTSYNLLELSLPPCPLPPPPLPLVPPLVRRLQGIVRLTSTLLPTSRSSLTPRWPTPQNSPQNLSPHLVTHVEFDTYLLGPCSGSHVPSDTFTVYSCISPSLILYPSFRHRFFSLSC